MYSEVLALLGGLAIVRASSPTHWFLFGDSYTWPNFNHSHRQPDDVNPFGNPALPGHTICGVVPNYVYYAAVQYNRSLTYAYNFARAGATINATLVPGGTNLTLVAQAGEFEEAYSGPSPPANVSWSADNSLFSLWFGINDIGGSYNRVANQPSLHDALVESYFLNLQRLYSLSARKFLLLNVPPTDRSPLMLADSQENQSKYKAGVLDLNAKLASRVASFETTHPGVSVWTFDTHALVTSILDDPRRYGFADAVSYSSARTDVAWCGRYHVSPTVHDYIAQGIRDALANAQIM